MLENKTEWYGMYSYPEFLNLTPDSLLWNRNVYFIRNYNPGLTLKTETSNDNIKMTIANWDGSDRTQCDQLLLTSLEYNNNIAEHFRIVGINDYQLFIDDQCKIVDVVVDGTFISPGMLKDLLLNNYNIQTILAHGLLTDESLSKMIKDHGSFYIKPMMKLLINDVKHRPYYAKIL